MGRCGQGAGSAFVTLVRGRRDDFAGPAGVARGSGGGRAMTGSTGIPPIDPPVQAGAEDAFQMLGLIQGHGAVLVLAEAGLEVEQASANLVEFLGVTAEAALGRPLSALLPEGTVLAVLAALKRATAEKRATADNGTEGALPLGASSFRLLACDGRTPLHAVLYRQDGRVLLELETVAVAQGGARGEEADFRSSAPQSPFDRDLDGAGNIYEVARLTVELVSEVARFDRTLIYTFLPDDTVEVIAETRRPAAVAFLGLRFPATDFPPSFRRLAELTPQRVIADTQADPVAVVPAINPGIGRPFDFSRTILRPVTSAHLRYLRNLGAMAALDISLMVEGRLWGVIACHHEVPRLATPALREHLGRIATRTAVAIERRVRSERIESERQVARRLAVVEHTIGRADNVVRQLLASDPGLLDLAAADGLAVVAGGDVATFGLTPDLPLVRRLAALVVEQPDPSDRPLAVDCLTTLDPAAVACREAAAGMLAVALTRDPQVVIAAFRREVVHEVSWGGDPNGFADAKKETSTSRRSFQKWRETVVGHCRPWEPEIVAAWRALPSWLGTAFGGYGAASARLVGDLDELMLPERFDEPFLRALLNAVSGTLLVTSDGPGDCSKVLITNRDFRQIFRVAPDELIGLALGEALTLVGLVDAHIPELPPGGALEATVLTAGRGERIIEISHRPLLRLCRGGRDRAFAAWMFEDITRVRRVEQALQSARDQAVVASRAKTEFLANMSHELRTPLNAIIGFSEIMRAELFGALGSAKYREYVRNIQTSGEHLLAVIGEVLDISKVEAGHYVLEEQVINLISLVEDICVLESDQAERAGVKLMQEVTARDIHVQCDERALKQILLNLLSNAFKFTPAGGMVTCRALLLTTGGIALEVQDTGIGIPEEHLHRVLDPFVQVRDRHTRKSAGTGLGLSLVRVLAELHGGRVTVNSQPGRGTAIRVSLPPWRAMPGGAGVKPGSILPTRTR